MKKTGDGSDVGDRGDRGRKLRQGQGPLRFFFSRVLGGPLDFGSPFPFSEFKSVESEGVQGAPRSKGTGNSRDSCGLKSGSNRDG